MKIKINNVRIALLHEVSLHEAIAKKLGLDKKHIQGIQVLRRAVDARRKTNICLNYHVLVNIDIGSKQGKKLLQNNDVDVYQVNKAEKPLYGITNLTERPLVIGAGPAGLLAALELARYGYKPLLLERGKPIAERIDDVEKFWQQGIFNPTSNVQFGEGGAGTFSDGKLTTRLNDPVMGDILQTFVEAGGPTEILTEQKPHVGTDRLRIMVTGLSKRIRALGGEICYGKHVTELITEQGKCCGVILEDGQKIFSEVVILACGHSARDTYTMLVEKQVAIEGKPFAIGVRIEHPQALIDKAQYGEFAGHPLLGAADYALIYHTQDRSRTAYSFCMCPGGKVVAAASEAGGVVVNGMSMYERDSGIANSALVVNVGPQDFGHNPLDGVAFQRKYEQLAFAMGGGNYTAPAQNVSSFLKGNTPKLSSMFDATYRPSLLAVDLTKVLPDYVTSTLRGGLLDFDRKIKGFATDEALLTGVETRTSAPLRIIRDRESLVSISHQGLYPCGEGAGYAGGIMSAALDGYHVARAVMHKFAPFEKVL